MDWLETPERMNDVDDEWTMKTKRMRVVHSSFIRSGSFENDERGDGALLRDSFVSLLHFQ
jgi:hypothetical protein